MHTTLHISNDLNRAIMLRSHHQRNKPRQVASKPAKRLEAVYGTKSYWDGLQRAFNKAKMQIYFNPDMTNFVTLTYAKADNTVEEVLQDVKILIKKERRANDRLHPAGSGRVTPKYIYIMEYQKRGSIHVHMIANNFFTLQVNKNGYNELANWPKGFSSILTINDLDENFKPYLYLFKYMKKAQRIGHSFVHSSRNLTNYYEVENATIDLENWDTINMEHSQTTIETTNFQYYKNYLKFRDTINPQLKTNPTKGELDQWQINLKLHSNKALLKLQESLIQPSHSKSEHGQNSTSQTVSNVITLSKIGNNLNQKLQSPQQMKLLSLQATMKTQSHSQVH